MLLLCCEVSGVLEADDGNPYMPIPFELPERLKKGDV